MAKARKSMSWTWNQAEQLRSRVDEVEYLRHKEEEQGLREMSQDSDNRENHPGEIAVGVSDEDSSRVPIMPPESKRDADKGEDHVEREEMRVCCRMGIRNHEVENIIQD